MSIDAYSLCPGGTGKKIKFCCGDFLPELQKIDRMVAGEQYLACLQHIDRLLEKEPGHDRACLLATKCLLLRVTGQNDAARAASAGFLAKHPENQIALSEAAILAANEDARAALGLVVRSLRVAAGALSVRTYQAIGATAGAMLREGFPLSARALLQMMAAMTDENGDPENMLTALSRATDVPLPLRDDSPLPPCPEGAPWKDRFDAALVNANLGDWPAAAEQLAALAVELPDEPIVWRNLATLRGWLADNPACIDALRKYAALRAEAPDGLEDAVEAAAAAMFLGDDPLGDRLDMFKLVWTVRDAERAQESLLSSPRLRTIPFNPAQFSDGQTPPPKAAFLLLDRSMPESADGLTLENIPRLLGQALLFGRQTDREARLELTAVAADQLPAVKTTVVEAAGDAVDPQPNETVVSRLSASQQLFRAAWQPPRGTSPELLHSLFDQHRRQAMLDRWPELKLGILGGRSPREAAGDQSCRVALLAAIMVLEHWAERLPGRFDFNELRVRLGLPVFGPIDPRRQPLADLPTVRIGRLNVDELSDEDLIVAFYRAEMFAIRPALLKFASAIVERASLADSVERLEAYAALARNEEDIPRALQHIEEGRRAAEAKKHSSASWDLMELSLRFAGRDGQQAMRLIQHIQDRHLEEPGVGETLTRMLMDVGLLRPDGTPAFAPEAPEPAMAATDEPAGEPGRLWTPDNAQTGGGGKLWTPE